MSAIIEEKMAKARAAMAEIADYTQEQVDELLYEAAKVIYLNAAPLAKQAVEETGFGNYEDKIGKNTDTPTAFYDYLKDKKSVGIIREIPEENAYEIAHPVGVVAFITPATNPTVTPLGNFMHAIKGKNAGIVCPAPRSKKTSSDTVKLIREAIAAKGAPADIFQVIEEPTIALSAELMANADMVIATGSSALTKAAYSSGTPAYGVGPGNPSTLIDRGFDKAHAAEMLKVAVASDNGILCDGTNQCFYPKDEEAELFAEMEKHQTVIIKDTAVIDKLRDILFTDGKQNPEFIGHEATVLAEAAGLDVPADTKVLAMCLETRGGDEILNHEIMGPTVIMKSYDKFEEAVQDSIDNMVLSGGIGHTCSIYSNDEEHIKYYIERIPVARVLINQPSPDAWGPSSCALTPAVSEGCGSWGNNILAGNVDFIHTINVSKAVKPLDIEMPDGEKIFK